MFGEVGSDSMYGGNGRDYMRGDDLAVAVTVGRTYADTMYGNEGDDDMAGVWGDDKIYGLSGNDSLYGNDGNDFLDGGIGNDLLSGGNGDDTMTGFDGRDTFYGDAGVDRIDGGSGADVIYGGDGNDFLRGGADNDQLFGGNGVDNISGEAGNDTMYGGNDNDSMFGGEGADRVFGEMGNDWLFGGDGDDVLTGGKGNDYVGGGAGFDTVWVDDPDTIREVIESVRINVPTDQSQIDGSSCGPNTASRVLRFYGITNANYMDLRAITRVNGNLVSSFNMGTPPEALYDTMRLFKSDVQVELNSTFENVLNVLGAGKPIAALVGWGKFSENAFGLVSSGTVPTTLHWVTLTGYDSATQRIFYTDTNGAQKSYTYQEFQDKWNFSASGAAGDFLTGTLRVKQRSMVY